MSEYISFSRRSLAQILAILWLSLPAPAWAAITTSGALNPDNYNNDDPWNVNGQLYIGLLAPGSLTIDGGSTVTCDLGLLGGSPEGIGEVNVSGNGSRWRCSDSLYVGYTGVGKLNIGQGAIVDVQVDTQVGRLLSGSGSITFSGGTLKTGALLAAPDELLGAGVINTAGLVSDLNLVLDQARSSGQQIILNDLPGQNITINLTPSAPSYNSVLGAGYRGTGSLSITEGVNALSRYGQIGYYSGSNGSVVVQGPGTAWGNAYDLTVGNFGNGDMLIEAGGSVTNETGVIGDQSGSVGQVILRDVDSSWSNTVELVVGDRGSGVMEVQGGASVTSPRVSIGNLPGSSGGVVVDGNGSRIEVPGRINVGDNGRGSLTVSNSGSVTSDTVLVALASSIGTPVGTGDGVGELFILSGGTLTTTGRTAMISGNDFAAGYATVSGAGSSWSVSETLTVGYEGNAYLEITDGAVVSDDTAIIGDRPFGLSSGEVLVSGAGSLWTHGTSLTVGRGGGGKLTINSGARVVSDSVSIGSYGEIVVSGEGSTLLVGGDSGIQNTSGGSLTIEDGGRVDVYGTILLSDSTVGDGTLYISGGTLDLHGYGIAASVRVPALKFTGGTIRGASAFNVQMDQEGGRLAPGEAIGTTTIYNHGYNLMGGTLEIEVGGEGNTHDRLNVKYDINIALTGTTLDLPALGAMSAGTYTIIESTGGTITGMFENVTGIGLYAGLVDVQYTSNAVSITLNWDFLPGDLNGDGFVGVDDLNLILPAWNQSVTPGDLSGGDLTGDGFVGIDDLNVVLVNWNAGTPPPVEALALVPEPGTVGVLVFTGGLFGFRRKRS